MSLLTKKTENELSSLYLRLGGEVVIRQFVNHLYDYMASSDQAEDIRKMHSGNLSFASDKLFMCLSGMFGGPLLYVDAFIHPKLRCKHLQFPVRGKERDQWLTCAQYAANLLLLEPDIRKELISKLDIISEYLRSNEYFVLPCDLATCHDRNASSK